MCIRDRYLNGSPVGSGGKLTLPYSRNCFTPQMFMLPQALLKPGVNTIHIQVVGYPLRQVSAAQRSSGLSVVRVGASDELRPLYEQALWWNITLPKVITALLGAFTVFIGALWLTRPRDTYYGYFTLWIGWWTLNTTRLYIIDPPLPGPGQRRIDDVQARGVQRPPADPKREVPVVGVPGPRQPQGAYEDGKCTQQGRDDLGQRDVPPQRLLVQGPKFV